MTGFGEEIIEKIENNSEHGELYTFQYWPTSLIIEDENALVIDEKIAEITQEQPVGILPSSDALAFNESIPAADTAIIKPNLNSIRKILGGDGTDQQRKVVEENTGLIPKYYKVNYRTEYRK